MRVQEHGDSIYLEGDARRGKVQTAASEYGQGTAATQNLPHRFPISIGEFQAVEAPE